VGGRILDGIAGGNATIRRAAKWTTENRVAENQQLRFDGAKALEKPSRKQNTARQ